MTRTANVGEAVAPLLELTDIHYAYREGIPALSGLSLSVFPGERVAVLGANGCGKSTPLKLLAGLIFPRQRTEFQKCRKYAPVIFELINEAAPSIQNI